MIKPDCYPFLHYSVNQITSFFVNAAIAFYFARTIPLPLFPATGTAAPPLLVKAAVISPALILPPQMQRQANAAYFARRRGGGCMLNLGPDHASPVAGHQDNPPLILTPRQRC